MQQEAERMQQEYIDYTREAKGPGAVVSRPCLRMAARKTED